MGAGQACAGRKPSSNDVLRASDENVLAHGDARGLAMALLSTRWQNLQIILPTIRAGEDERAAQMAPTTNSQM